MQQQRRQRGQHSDEGNGPVHDGVAVGQFYGNGIETEHGIGDRHKGQDIAEAGKGIELAYRLAAACPYQAQRQHQQPGANPGHDIEQGEISGIDAGIFIDHLHIDLDFCRQLSGQQRMLQTGGRIGLFQFRFLGQQIIDAGLFLIDLAKLLVNSILGLLHFGNGGFIAFHCIDGDLLTDDLDHHGIAGVGSGDFLIQIGGGHIAGGLLLFQISALGIQGCLPVDKLEIIFFTAFEIGLGSLHFFCQQGLQALCGHGFNGQALYLIVFTHQLIRRAGNRSLFLNDIRIQRSDGIIMEGGDGQEHANEGGNDQNCIDDKAVPFHFFAPLLLTLSRSFIMAERISEQITMMPKSTTDAALATLKLLGVSKPC